MAPSSAPLTSTSSSKGPTMEHVAVLIDCDNISRDHARAILAETARHGTLSVKRGYGDWTRLQLQGWRGELTRYAVQPVQQFAYVAGKNATDSALIIDAMDLLYADNITVFCIVSSDSDFTRLAVRLRESGRRVYGIGARHTPDAFTNACDRFTYLDLLPNDAELLPQDSAAAPVRADRATREGPPASTTITEQPRLDPARALPLLRSAILASADDDGWAYLSTVGNYIVNTDPTFDARAYGHAKLGSLARHVPGLEVRALKDAPHVGQLRVRVTNSRT
ncbi:NYN domain-containing protein [Cellulomonas chengniuliangii]|uniref:NYN domain-containing protein n=1 Tax=Cellulomonas chengniuliangii TaxID=2968084 RepID=A0ABY5KZJ4_9CELL|nr:NYN domain-containing protein [Cellulomonas chengniuliangii]MCC2307652.1 NYN domain-containing protein [Cellulomonas chengniuliangii]MCC2318760.1 NYN domain-containing protein [Cellulomonas chengniuliangii]UUI75584.1 NYN domain-containing protein [Cellulomonas chengniuliangii]